MEVLDRKYYMEKHDKLIARAVNLANAEYTAQGTSEDKRDYSSYIEDEELCANAEEVAGYYLKNYPDNTLKKWKENTRDIKLDTEELKVSKILENFN